MASSGSISSENIPHVLQVTGGLEAGGSDIVVLSAAEALAGQCEMDYLVFGENRGKLEDRALATGGRVLRMKPLTELGPVKFLKELELLLVNNHYDAVHSHINLGAGLIMRAAEAAGVPIRITHSHSTRYPSRGPIHSLYQLVSRKLIVKHSTSFAACGQEAGKALLGSAWEKADARVIPNGIKVDDFVNVRERRASVRTSLDLSADQLVVGIIARLVPEKNHNFILDVMALDKKLGGEAVLLMIGDGALREDLEHRVVEFGLSDRVRFLGVRQDIPDLLATLDLLVLPSLFEGIPLVLIEAQAAGIPALVSEGVPHEVDLGLGLLNWLSLDEPSAWQRAFYNQITPPNSSDIQRRFEETGYSLESSAQLFLRMYNPPSIDRGAAGSGSSTWD